MNFSLAIFDIDGTFRTAHDPWMNVHERLGVTVQAAAFAEQCKAGKLSYQAWAEADAALWKGASYDEFVAVHEANPLRRGAKELVAWLKEQGILCAAISSGLDVFNDRTAKELGLAYVRSNRLIFEGTVCTGKVDIQIADDCKGKIFNEMLDALGFQPESVIAFGDGCADIPMMKRAGLGIAVCPAHDDVRAAAAHVIEQEPIDAVIPFLDRLCF